LIEKVNPIQTITGVLQAFNTLTTDQLQDAEFLEFFLLPSLGLNDEQIHEQPSELSSFFGGGLGCHIFQYPNQFAKYLSFIAKNFSISSYLEIGCRFGGTFITTSELLRKHSKAVFEGVAVDIIAESPIMECYRNSSIGKIQYLNVDSQSDEFTQFISNKRFDLVLIDGDHSYNALKKDAECVFDRSNIMVFHDILSDACPDVSRYWNEFKSDNQLTHLFFEFTDQYESVSGDFLGIGVAVRKNFFNSKNINL
jgi:predicted O-methyltransferase YrrM